MYKTLAKTDNFGNVNFLNYCKQFDKLTIIRHDVSSMHTQICPFFVLICYAVTKIFFFKLDWFFSAITHKSIR